MKKKILRFLNFLKRYFSFLILFFFAATFGLLLKKYRGLIKVTLDYFNLTSLFNSKIKKISTISHLELIENHELILLEPVSIDGSVIFNELVIINSIIKKVKPKTIFEFGTFEGRTTLNMAINSPDNCKIITLDLLKKDLTSISFTINKYDKTLVNKKMVGERLQKYDSTITNKIMLCYGDSAKFDFTPYQNSIDLIFIDGAHSYNFVLSDSLNALKLLRNKKGIILWHDYKDEGGVVRAIDKLMKDDPSLKIYNIKGTTLAYLELK